MTSHPPTPASTDKPTPPVPKRVLVVDDSRDARMILQLLLTKLGHEARTAEDAETGLTVSREFRPEIILCDLMLGSDQSGFTFAQAARRDSSIADICLIAVSGWEGPEYEEQAYAAGFDRMLKKPVGLAELQQILGSPPRRTDRPSDG